MVLYLNYIESTLLLPMIQKWIHWMRQLNHKVGPWRKIGAPSIATGLTVVDTLRAKKTPLRDINVAHPDCTSFEDYESVPHIVPQIIDPWNE